MRVALLSDIHANMAALRALDDVLREADRVVCLGDIVGYYCEVNEVLATVRALDPLCVRGNHDTFLLEGIPESATDGVRFGIEHARRVIEPDHLRWLRQLPLTWGGDVDGGRWLIFHGSPWEPLAGYMYADSPRLGELRDFAYDMVAFGQTHRPMVDASGVPRLVNPGSVGQSRHAPAVACAALVDSRSFEVTMVERSYDPGPVIDSARRNGAGDWVTKHL